MQKYFLSFILINCIFSIAIFPVILYLAKNKHKFNPKTIYKIEISMCILLFLPIIGANLNFNIFKNRDKITYNTENKNYATILEKDGNDLVQNSKVQEYEIERNSEEKKEELQISSKPENDMSFKLNNIIIYKVYKFLPIVWIITSVAVLSYYYIAYKKYIANLKMRFEENQEISRIINKYKTEMNIKRKIQYAFSSKITSSITTGIINKVIVIPNEYELKDYEYILKHEIFHIKNKDIEMKLLCVILEIIYFFNPIVRFLEKEISETIELNCDYNILLNENDDYRKEYGNILLKQIEKNKMNRCRLATSFAHSKRRNIMNRFSNIISGKNKKRGVIVAGLVALIILISLAVMVSMPDITVTYAKKAEEVVAQNANIDTLEKDIEQNDSKDNIAENEEENTNAEISKQEVEQKANTNKETNEKSSDKNEEIKEDSSKEVSNKTEEKSSSEKTTTEENNKTVKSTEKTKEESGDTKTVTNTQETKTENKESKIKLSMPIKENYALSVKYSSRHTGIDLASLNGTNIYAAAKGKVIVSEFQQELGNVIVIDHGNGVKTYYACCSKLLKNVGDSVTENDVIAQVGQSGNSTGPHLHFEVRINDKVQNPEPFLPNL